MDVPRDVADQLYEAARLVGVEVENETQRRVRALEGDLLKTQQYVLALSDLVLRLLENGDRLDRVNRRLEELHGWPADEPEVVLPPRRLS